MEQVSGSARAITHNAAAAMTMIQSHCDQRRGALDGDDQKSKLSEKFNCSQTLGEGPVFALTGRLEST